MLFRPRKSGKMKSVKALLALEDHLFEEFRRCAPQLSNVKLRDDGDDDWPWYFPMQHHGAPNHTARSFVMPRPTTGLVKPYPGMAA
jgi:hypothetical protein